MARKSRKNKEEIQIREVVPELLKERKIKVGGYVRLSSDQNDSDSIETQILMIKQYVNNHPEMEIEEFYSDEGFTGTNFARPDFVRMMNDARFGRIDCIVVKDFSRFGRNYIEAGYYLETVLPHLGIRFISINDRFDSNREEDRNGISAPIKNLINSMYAADVSKKIVNNVELHHKIGDSKYRTTTYGYFLNREENRLEIDPVASRIVKLIFGWYVMGYSTHEIIDRLNTAEILIPSKYKEQYTKRKSSSQDDRWTHTTVLCILKNQVYIGNKVNGKQKTRLSEKLDHHLTTVDEWYIHENDHEAIISKEIFEAVNAKIEEQGSKHKKSVEAARELSGSYNNVFAKKIVCGDCGRTMMYVRKNKGATKYGFQEAYYTCSRDKDDGCRQVVYEDYIKTVVLDQIKELFRYVSGQKDVISSLRDGTSERSLLKSYETMLVNQKKKEADCDNLIMNLYKDLSDEVIDADEYKELNSKYRQDKHSIQEKIKRTNESIFKMKKWIDALEDLGEKLGQYLTTDTDTQFVIDELIDKVTVYSDNRIEIQFTCADVIEQFKRIQEDVYDETNCHILKAFFG